MYVGAHGLSMPLLTPVPGLGNTAMFHVLHAPHGRSLDTTLAASGNVSLDAFKSAQGAVQLIVVRAPKSFTRLRSTIVAAGSGLSAWGLG